MKVAYVAPFRDGTGYSHSAIEHILALDSVGIEVVPRSIKMTQTKGEVPDRILELEEGNLDNVDVLVQHNLPSEFSYKGGVKNVGIFAYETTHFKNSNWPQHLELMDQVIVSSAQQVDATKSSCNDMGNRVKLLPHPVNHQKFMETYDPMDFGVPENCVKFYTISELGRRKNLPALLTAYYTAFSSLDNVLLVVKTHAPGRNSEYALKYVKEICDDLKRAMNKFKNPEQYPKIAIITEYLSDYQINCLHNSCDVFCSASHGEAICLPVVDALGFCHPTIAPKHSAFLDYVYDQDLLVESIEYPVSAVDSGIPGIYTADETWWNVGVRDFANKMRLVYENIEDFQSYEKCYERFGFMAENFSRTVVGKKFEEYLNAD